MSEQAIKKGKKTAMENDDDPLFARVGLIGCYDRESVESFIEDIRKLKNENVNFSIKESNDICVNCLHAFVANNRLTFLFFGENLKINGKPTEVYDQIVSYIRYLYNCTSSYLCCHACGFDSMACYHS